jgi:hypothetical protein
MHFVLSYDLSATGARRTELESQIETIINPYRHVRRLTTFYIIHVVDNNEWESIRRQLSNLSSQITERLHFIMSPLMEGGHYNGMLPESQWADVNSITNLD